MPTTPTTNPAAQLASAVQSSNFEAAQPLIVEYGSTVQAQLRSAASAEERRRIYDQAIDTLSEHLRLARLMRSHMHLRLRQLSGESLYNGPGQPLHTWRLDA